MTDILFDDYGHPISVLVDPRHPQRLFDDYGRPHIVLRDASGLDLAAANTISVLARRGVWVPYFNVECLETWNAGSGFGWAFLNGRTASTGTEADSSHMSSGILAVGRNGAMERYNWDKASVFHFYIVREGEDSEVIARTQFKGGDYPPQCEQLTACGIGLEVRDLALHGESCGVVHAGLDLGTELVPGRSAEVLILHYPAEKIEWYVNGILKGVQADPVAIPSGEEEMTVCNSIANGASGGVNARYYCYGFDLWRAQ